MIFFYFVTTYFIESVYLWIMGIWGFILGAGELFVLRYSIFMFFSAKTVFLWFN